MSMSIIRATLMQALAAYATACTPPLQIARENVSFQKPPSGAFLEAFFIPANTLTPNVAADRRRFTGTFQVNVWTSEGIGVGLSETIGEEIAQLFPVWPKTYLPLSIETPASIKQEMSDISGWRVTPITFTYRFESTN